MSGEVILSEAKDALLVAEGNPGPKELTIEIHSLHRPA
jgi:hypothetical protein